MRAWLERLPLMLATALLLTLGAWRVDAGGRDGAPLLLLGAVTLGSWIALEARSR